MKTLLWMKKGKRSDGILCFTTVTSLLAAAALTAALIGYYHKYNLELKQMNLSNVCLTPGCIKAASIILSRLDENVDPCDDFYQFACGEWLKTHHIPDDRSHINVYDEAVDNIDLQLKILWETKLNDTEPSFIRMAKDLYGTCMDIKSIEKAGAEPLKDLLKNLGGWPVVEGKKWDERKFDWLETLISIRKLGYRYNCLVSFYVDIDTRNSSRHIVSLGGGTLGMDSTYLIRGLNDSVTAAYYKKMVKAATLFGADESMAEKELLEALKFEMILANYSSPLEEETNISKSDNNYTVKSLQKMAPQIPWLKYINGFQVYEIHEDETLKINDIEIIQKIADLITRTEKRVIANYILWRQVDDSLMMLSKEWRQISLDYSRVYTGAEEEPPRWRQCLPHFLGIAQNSYYVRHHFEDKTKEQISKLVKYVHKEFLRILDEIDWMDEKTKTHAKAKANYMMFRIGYPEQLLNNTIVMELYQNLTISNDSYFENLLRIYKYVADDYFSKLRKPNDRTNWIRFAEVVTNVNAYYSYEDNVITIPVGWMGNPFFSNDRPNYLNFAGIGYTIGHGITHGFDDSGRQYDKDGNNVNWWEKVADEKFRKKAQCIIDQYSNYTTETGQNLNGVNSQDENIADNGGLKESYWAYQSWIKDNGPEKLLPGLKYNQNQLFWIGYASLNWCGKFRPEFLNNFIISDAHMTNEFRVIGPLSNLDEFARDFNCLLDSPMNKKHKCQVW